MHALQLQSALNVYTFSIGLEINNNLYYFYFHFNTFNNVKMYNPLEFQIGDRVPRPVRIGFTASESLDSWLSKS